MSFLRDLAVSVPVMFLCACVTAVVLWRLRRWGYWLVLVGFGLFLALSLLGQAVAPAVMSPRLHGGTPPAQMGILIGCFLPTINFVFNSFGQGKGR